MHVTMIVGRMGSDPKPLGQAGVYFSVATDRYVGQGKPKETTWSRIKVFGKQADFVRQYLGKGRMVSILAHYEVSEYTDANTQQTRQDHYFVADRIDALPDGGGQQHGNFQPRQQQPDEDLGKLW